MFWVVVALLYFVLAAVAPSILGLFVNRARLMTDENGYYEYETIHPGAYRIGPNAWRPPHIHYWVRKQNYRDLVTQLYFRGDAHQREDQFIRQSLIVPGISLIYLMRFINCPSFREAARPFLITFSD